LNNRFPELYKGKIPVIVRANHTLICHHPATFCFSEMAHPPPLTTGDDESPWDGVDLWTFGPSFSAIKGDGDELDSSIPLPTLEKSKVSKSKESRKRKHTHKEKKGMHIFSLLSVFVLMIASQINKI
jgi:hypothetical protein